MTATTFNRRSVIAASAGVSAWAMLPRAASARTPQSRLVVLVLRGAMDGLSAVPPVGDPEYEALRPGLALSLSGPGAASRLEGPFALHPALPTLARLYAAKQMAVIHATATPYRARSHFEAQDVLETGTAIPYALSTGWLNRAVGHLATGGTAASPGAISVSGAPRILAGAAPTISWAPPVAKIAPDSLYQATLDLYAQEDPVLFKALTAARGADRLAAADGADARAKFKQGERASIQLARAQGADAARFIKPEDGPRVAVVSLEAFDTHAAEGAAEGRLQQALGGLDACVEGLQQGLGPLWADTAVLAITEFGRTARANGTGGTDHGTGTAAFLMGGRVKGGRVLGDWPGLKSSALLDGRDLRPTTDLRAVQKGLLIELLGASPQVLATDVFPGSAAVKPLQGLLV